MDYDDLLLETLRLFDDHAGRAKRRGGVRMQHVLVDEYQDTNPAQARARRSASRRVHGNVMAVGDDAQSIYRFRGADFDNIFGFPDRFPGARLLKLEENYRSTQPILDLANAVLTQARAATASTCSRASRRRRAPRARGRAATSARRAGSWRRWCSSSAKPACR